MAEELNTPNPWAGIVAHLADVPASEPAKPQQRFNPHPKGSIQPGSVVDKFFKVFQAQPGRVFTCEMLRHITGASHAAASWALIHLRATGRIDGTENMAHRGYMVYRLRKVAEDSQ